MTETTRQNSAPADAGNDTVPPDFEEVLDRIERRVLMLGGDPSGKTARDEAGYDAVLGLLADLGDLVAPGGGVAERSAAVARAAGWPGDLVEALIARTARPLDPRGAWIRLLQATLEQLPAGRWHMDGERCVLAVSECKDGAVGANVWGVDARRRSQPSKGWFLVPTYSSLDDLEDLFAAFQQPEPPWDPDE